MKNFITLCFTVFTVVCQAQNIVVINEFMASNDSLSGISDPAGGYPDWIEIYNPGATGFDLAGYKVSDNYTVTDKFVFPAGSFIDGNGYVIIWADKDLEEEGFHADFRLAAEGERIILSAPDNTVLDSITYGPQETNVSFARIPNGTGPFTFRAPTFSANNDVVATIEQPFLNTVSVYPNPNPGVLNYKFELSDNFEKKSVFSLRVCDKTGKFVQDLSKSSFDEGQNIFGSADLSNLPDGIYFLILQNDRNIFSKKILLRK